MTLIAVFSIKGVPVLISDILLSADYGYRERTLPEIEIPTLGKIPFLVGKNNDKEVTGIIQKTTIINDNCIVGWAGNLKNIFNLIEKLKEIPNINQWNFDLFHDWFEKITLECQVDNNPKPIFIAVYHDNERRVRIISSQPYINTKLFDKVLSIGSGSTKFIEMIKKIDNMPKDFPFHPNSNIFNEVNPIIKVVSDSMFIVGEYLKEDFFKSKQSLGNLFGGFYELSVWYEGCFRKIVGQRVLFWLYINKQLHLKTVLIPTYEKSNLLIDSFEFEKNDLKRKDKYTIQTISQYFGEEEMKKKMQIKIPILHNIILRLSPEEKLIGVETVQLVADNIDSAFQIKNFGDQIGVMISPELKTQILTQIKNSLDNKNEK